MPVYEGSSVEVETRPNEVAPCGVFCGACPSFGKSCQGCPATDREQQRTSKWSCKIRVCCYEVKGLDFCGECPEFPCAHVNKKLLNSHPGEMKYNYRHQVAENWAKLRELGLEAYLEYQRERWTCPTCGDRVFFYHYKCGECGRDVTV